jgi:hypothetical protein
LNGNSSADADALDADGMRYQIKCRRLETPAGSRQLGFIRRLPDKPFDQLAAVLLDGKFRVLRGALIPYEVVEPRATYVDSVKAWRFMLRDSVLRRAQQPERTRRIDNATNEAVLLIHWTGGRVQTVAGCVFSGKDDGWRGRSGTALSAFPRAARFNSDSTAKSTLFAIRFGQLDTPSP